MDSGSSRPGPASAPGSRELGVSCLFQSRLGDSGVLRLFMVRRAVPTDWELRAVERAGRAREEGQRADRRGVGG